MKNLWLWLGVGALVQLAGATQAQAVPAPDEMAQLAFIIGDWRGTGWILVKDTRHTFTQTEHVESHAGGAILTIDGVGESGDAADGGRLVHQAYGSVSYDVNAGIFRWYSVESSGVQIVTEAGVANERLTWSAPAEGGGVDRYTITRNASGQWFEVGERSQDGSCWQQFFEMTLDRIQ